MNRKSAYYSILSILEQIRESDFQCNNCPLDEICDIYIEKTNKTICEKLEGDLMSIDIFKIGGKK